MKCIGTIYHGNKLKYRSGIRDHGKANYPQHNIPQSYCDVYFLNYPSLLEIIITNVFQDLNSKMYSISRHIILFRHPFGV